MLRQYEGFESRDGKKVKYDEMRRNIQHLGLTMLMKIFKQDAKMWGMCGIWRPRLFPSQAALLLGLHDASTSIGPLHVHMAGCIKKGVVACFPLRKTNNVKSGEVQMRRPQIMRNIHEQGSRGRCCEPKDCLLLHLTSPN